MSLPVSSDNRQISSSQFNEYLESKKEIILLDVREREEYEFTSLPNSTLIPVNEIEDNLEKIKSLRKSSDVPLVVICRSGGRSNMITEMLYSHGFSNVLNLSGGINELSKIRKDISAY